MRVLSILLSLLLFANVSFAAPYKGDARSARIPAGTELQIQLLQTVDTMANQEGDICNFVLLNNLKSHKTTVLPSGSIIRGNISKLKTAKRCSRGAVLYIDFDHIVTPTGRQLPLSLSLMGLEKMTIDGGIYFNKGYGEAVQDNWKKCVDITKSCTNYGMKAGVSAPGIQYVTAPICAIGGVVGGGCYLVGDTVFDLFKKGQDVIFYKGTKFKSKLVYPIDVPVS